LAELRLDEQRRQIAHMGRVAIVGELAATVSHDLRQPLAAIRANAEVALRLVELSAPRDQLREILCDIVADDKRAAEIIDHIRTLLRKDQPTETTVDLNEICAVATALLERDAQFRGTELMLSCAPGAALVRGDPVQLQQVVMNLALNAIDAAAVSSGERVIAISTVVDEGGVELSVRDTGPGLAPEVAPHLFESFYSTKSQGLGMGLVIVRSIADRHGGRVHAENSTTGGAVFRVFFPSAGHSCQ
jgi:signal transduction histidine kinase